MNIRMFVATKALIEHEGKLLIVRESSKYEDGTQVGRWDVPGGRLEPGQHFLDSLKREISEETGLQPSIGDPLAVNEWRPVKNGEQWQVVATFFLCSSSTDRVVLSDDHDNFKWINPNKYKQYGIIPTNLPAFEAYLRLKQSQYGIE